MDTDEEGDRSLESDMLETGGFITGRMCELDMFLYRQYLFKVLIFA